MLCSSFIIKVIHIMSSFRFKEYKQLVTKNKNKQSNKLMQDFKRHFLFNVVNDSHMLVVEQPEDEENTICNCLEEDAACSHI